jgi:hypothetical protein
LQRPPVEIASWSDRPIALREFYCGFDGFGKTAALASLSALGLRGFRK